MTFNAELGEKVLAKIDAHPEAHSQKYFLDVDGKWHAERGMHVCGTTLCIAGHTLVESGEWVVDAEQRTFVHAKTGEELGSQGRYGNVGDVAAELLGLGPAVAHGLFFTMNDELAVWKLRGLVTGAYSPDSIGATAWQ